MHALSTVIFVQNRENRSDFGRRLNRSVVGMTNSIVPFAMEEPEMEAYVKASDATYLLICLGFNYDGLGAQALASGETFDWPMPRPWSPR